MTDMGIRRGWMLPALAGLLTLALAGCDREQGAGETAAAADAAPAADPARTPPPADDGVRATTFAELVPGIDYQLVDPAPPASPGEGPIAVAEAFSYACGHCAKFEPMLEEWVAKLPPDVAFEAVPMPFNEVWTEFARAHYAAIDLGLAARTHAALFQALHAQGVRIDSPDSLAQWFSETGGGDAGAFRTAMLSPGTDARIEGARARAQRWGVDSTPTLVIDERFKVLGFAEAEGGFARTLAVADLLLAEVRRSRAPSA